ncbi:virulence RhuM family protein [Phaeovulum vinaykumarii]|uniref:Uncharacterized conserved protein n=1 Tax=Phaeovulum vinaykumarii TaxID=407234 RepID=A0A1N7MZS0_9RHOB|nr:virulence RhuM family protein [Phaeovulum vinaykumarii]SIS91585.1 Uncharacterized conserved protein [Phaeovulum vinaykumarii]SOC17571.1 hypothetical protein SAMN05878426_11232 [Phaeovulum vinaykumarii]
MSEGEIILYSTEDGQAEIQLRAVDGTVWLTQAQMADLFDTTKQNISLHINNVISDGELASDSVVKESLIPAADGKSYLTKTYSLDAILAVGYRVRSPRGVQFRRWATTTLKDYLVKGFVMNDARLKDPAWDHFDELLERIRDIRASEARFYQKVRDILALSEDYDPKSPAATTFYATIQNKMLYAVTSHTAGELIRERADADQPNMGLTTWKNADTGRPLRKSDVGTAKNYLGEAEIKELNLIVTMFLDTAELRASRRQGMRLADWEGVLDTFLSANELPKLHGAGTVSARQAEQIAHDRYAAFDAKRKEAARQAVAEANDLEELQRIADVAKVGKRGRRDA